MTAEPFIIKVPDEVLTDLRQRLQRTRWPDEIQGSGWDYGANLGYMRELVAYWETGYDWRAQERLLNRLSHFTATLDGMTLHFVHHRGVGPHPMPLLLLHGWPDTFYEFHKVIGPLSDPAAHGGNPVDAFDVVVPSLPGYGFSGKPGERGWGSAGVGDCLARLMTDVLGYKRFAVHGGDWGAPIGTRIADIHPDNVAGLHLHMMGVQPRLGPDSAPLGPAEKEWQEHAAASRTSAREETGYMSIQGTRPQTLAYALNDSPAGLAAWIVEKYRRWSDCHGDLETRFTKDELLTNIMIYWVTQSANSASRLYYETFHGGGFSLSGQRVEVPTAFVSYPGGWGTASEPREWVERVYNVQRYVRMEEGGHFPALEVPEPLVEDIRTFFRSLR